MENLKDGALLSAAASAGFRAMLTTDKSMRFQQNEATVPLTVIVLMANRNVEEEVAKCVPEALAALESLGPLENPQVH